ncbi:predicted protein [Chaetoceros tenuissimus]|uniref:Uncharacterized protein n=1 Tax=Chaetoceros tenuissimus TaxID=426638 RepID=A0AAD3CGN1_9STRA|nr:predicted protein [Chaetoceros tenuissimus]
MKTSITLSVAALLTKFWSIDAFVIATPHSRKAIERKYSNRDAMYDIEHLLEEYQKSPTKDLLDIATPLQEFALHYDTATSDEKRFEILKCIEQEMNVLSEHMALLKSLSNHLKNGDDYLLEDKEILEMKHKLLKELQFLDGHQVSGLKDEIMTSIAEQEELQDEFMEEKMKKDNVEDDWSQDYTAWMGY